MCAWCTSPFSLHHLLSSLFPPIIGRDSFDAVFLFLCACMPDSCIITAAETKGIRSHPLRCSLREQVLSPFYRCLFSVPLDYDIQFCRHFKHESCILVSDTREARGKKSECDREGKKAASLAADVSLVRDAKTITVKWMTEEGRGWESRQFSFLFIARFMISFPAIVWGRRRVAQSVSVIYV